LYLLRRRKKKNSRQLNTNPNLTAAAPLKNKNYPHIWADIELEKSTQN